VDVEFKGKNGPAFGGGVGFTSGPSLTKAANPLAGVECLERLGRVKAAGRPSLTMAKSEAERIARDSPAYSGRA
jgi:hypothetical protein